MFAYMFRMDLIFHIGVGSNVVCSTEIGNARALVRGMDNRRFHAKPTLTVQVLDIQYGYYSYAFDCSHVDTTELIVG